MLMLRQPVKSNRRRESVLKDTTIIAPVKGWDSSTAQALKPAGYMDSRGVLFNKTTHPQLNTPLYALDEVKHD